MNSTNIPKAKQRERASENEHGKKKRGETRTGNHYQISTIYDYVSKYRTLLKTEKEINYYKFKY